MLTLPRFRVAIETDAEPIEHDVTVRGADQMHAEQLGARLGVGDLSERPLLMTYLWIFSALKREQRYDGDFASFQNVVLGMEGLTDEDVDPTETDPANTSP